MSRYFLNVRDGQDRSDLEGSVLPYLAGARMDAVILAGHLLQDRPGDVLQRDGWPVAVTDTGGTVLSRRDLAAKGDRASPAQASNGYAVRKPSA